MLESNLTAMGLSELQRAVVEASIDSRRLVLGGAGTGKTHVLAARIAHLIETNDVAPGSEILVLSFTRAVVRELKRRLREGDLTTRLVRPITFDAFATRFLRELPTSEVGPGWQDGGYDDRIATAAAAIRPGGAATEILGRYRHVFVDEIQDLVGLRADLVLELLDCVHAFTLLGDPAQAIYEYQVASTRHATTSAEFLKRVVAHFPDLETVILDRDFRAHHPHNDAIAEVGKILRDPRRPDAAARPRLVEILQDIDHVHTFDDLGYAVRGTHDRTAILSRTNAECLRVSQILFDADVDHHLQQEATDQVIPAWVASLFRGESRSSWSESRLRGLIQRRVGEGLDMPQDEAAIDFLFRVVRGAETVEIDALRDGLRWGLGGEPPLGVDLSMVTVSTVHRAKGLEFDRVFLGAPRKELTDDNSEELRVLYVALSRARDDVWSFKAPNRAQWWKPVDGDDRWVKSQFRKSSTTLGWEIRPADVDHVRPPGAGLVTADVASIQDRLAVGGLRGATVVLRLFHERRSEVPIPFYSVAIHDEPMGETTEHFGDALRRRLVGPNIRFPREISDVYVAGVETVVGSAVEGEANGLGRAGLWLRPRIAGLGRLNWHAE
jgi:hypothetical protein